MIQAGRKVVSKKPGAVQINVIIIVFVVKYKQI